MCDFKIWLTKKFYSTEIDSEFYDYWCNRMVQAYSEGELSAATTILEDYDEGLIWLSLSDLIILKASLEENV